MKKKIVVIGCVVLVVPGLYWLLGHKELASTAGKDATAVAQRGNLKIVVLSQGRISAKKSEKISHNVEGQLTIAKIVPEGKEVQKDEELVTFDNDKQKRDVEAADAENKNAETEVEIAQKALDICQRENAEALAQAQFKYNTAQLELEKSEKGELPRDERKLRLTIEQAESTLKQAKESYAAASDPEALKQGFVTPVEVEKERIALRSAEIQLELANIELELFETYIKRATLNVKQVDRDTARTNAAMVESVNANKTRQKQVELEAKQEKLHQTKNRLEEAQKKLTGTVLKAPASGLVLYGEQNENFWGGGREERIRVGGQISMNQTIITLPKLDELLVKTSVSEMDINKLKNNMEAIITSEAYPNMKEIGKIGKIATVAKRNWMEGNTYEIEIELRKGELGIKPGISTKVEIQVDELKDVLHVPISAVFNNEGRNFVYVKANGVSAREVKVGGANDTQIVITTGLKEGETVVLYEPENVPLPSKSDAKDKKEEPPAGKEKQPGAAKP